MKLRRILASIIVVLAAAAIIILLLSKEEQPTTKPVIVPARDFFFGESYSPRNEVLEVECLGGENYSAALALGLESRAQNVWDLEVVNKKLFIGSGDYDSNSGSAGLLYWDMQQEKFFSIPVCEEQISSFKPRDGKVLVPGIDVRDADCQYMGSHAYVYDNGDLETNQLFGAYHVFDVEMFDGKLWYGLGLGCEPLGSAIVRSTSREGWTDAVPVVDANGQEVFLYRVYNIIARDEDLFALGSIYHGEKELLGIVAKYNAEMDAFVITGANALGARYASMESAGVPVPHAEIFGDFVVYVSAGSIYITENFQNYLLTPSFTKDARVYDILVDGDALYVLVSRKMENGQYKILVYSTSDLEGWEENLEFEYGALARSFEFEDGTWFFGMGSDYAEEQSAHNGEVLKVTAG